MNGNQTLTVMDRNQELALENRISQFHQQYLTNISAEQKVVLGKESIWDLDDIGRVRLGAILRDSGYFQDGNVYRRLSVDLQQGKPVIDVLEFRDVLNNNNKSFSYIRLSNLEELDAYTQARDARLKGNFYDGGTAGLALSGMLLGAVMDIAGAIIASTTDWNPSAGWLLALPSGGVLLGAIIGGILEVSGSDKSKEATAFFQKQYQHRLTTGPEAILKALGYTAPPVVG